ncbi:DUF6326 family protein [Mesoflavibacter sp. CH_XMU1404-2]|uniref:DUF6326 family protein n=1 Tax=Mesoflavibacter sp. CH_XMU1404-2 TaxID=3107766 RepID=UPI00300A2D92
MKTKPLLSTLWIFLTVNYLFCDVFSLYYSETLNQLIAGKKGAIEFTQEFLLVFAIIMEMPLLMILFSRVLNYKPNRLSNIMASIFMIIIQVGSLIEGNNTLHYLFFSLVEIITLSIILWFSMKWKLKQL